MGVSVCLPARLPVCLYACAREIHMQGPAANEANINPRVKQGLELAQAGTGKVSQCSPAANPDSHPLPPSPPPIPPFPSFLKERKLCVSLTVAQSI